MQHTFWVEFYFKPFGLLPPPSFLFPPPPPPSSPSPFLPLFLSIPPPFSPLPPSFPSSPRLFLSLPPPLPPPQIARQILEAHASMLTLSMHDAKLQYIRNWQALQDFGITYFLVKVGRSRKEVS